MICSVTEGVGERERACITVRHVRYATDLTLETSMTVLPRVTQRESVKLTLSTPRPCRRRGPAAQAGDGDGRAANASKLQLALAYSR